MMSTHCQDESTGHWHPLDHLARCQQKDRSLVHTLHPQWHNNNHTEPCGCRPCCCSHSSSDTRHSSLSNSPSYRSHCYTVQTRSACQHRPTPPLSSSLGSPSVVGPRAPSIA